MTICLDSDTANPKISRLSLLCGQDLGAPDPINFLASLSNSFFYLVLQNTYIAMS